MRPAASEDQHVLFEAEIPVASSRAQYLFVLPDGRAIGAGGGAAQAFDVPRDLPHAEPPAWWRDAVLYTILIDRFRAGGRDGHWP